MSETKELPSKDLGEAIHRVLNDRLAGDYVEKRIEQSVDKLINETIEDTFRSYGDIGKRIKEIITSSVVKDLESFTVMPEFTQSVSNALTQAVAAVHQEEVAKYLNMLIKEITEVDPELETFEKMLQSILKEYSEDTSCHCGDEVDLDLSIVVDDDRIRNFTWATVEFNQAPHEERIKLRIYRYKDDPENSYKISSLFIAGVQVDKAMAIRRLTNVERALLAIYRKDGRLVMDNDLDADDYESTWSPDY
jgi:hypothetical protein